MFLFWKSLYLIFFYKEVFTHLFTHTLMCRHTHTHTHAHAFWPISWFLLWWSQSRILALYENKWEFQPWISSDCQCLTLSQRCLKPRDDFTLHWARKLKKNLQSRGINCKELLNQKCKLLGTLIWTPVQWESRIPITATSSWPPKLLPSKNKHGCALPKAFFSIILALSWNASSH